MKKTLAEALVNERKKTDIKLEQISDRTNIALKSLQDLENGNFERLPGTFYFRNYIKSYLKAVGSDEELFFQTYGEMVDAISAQDKEEKQADGYYSKLRYARFKKRNFVLSLIIFLILVVLGILLLFTDIGQNLLFGSGTDTPNGSSSVSGQTAPAGLTIPGNKWRLPDTSRKTDMDFAPVQVDVSFLKNCWFQAYRGNRKVEEKVFKAGEKATFKGYRIRLAVGNPSGVRLLINQKEVTYLKRLARSERLDITPATIKRILDR